jgi:hypothetical protein
MFEVADTFQISSQYFFGKSVMECFDKLLELIWNVSVTTSLIYYPVVNNSERIYSNGKMCSRNQSTGFKCSSQKHYLRIFFKTMYVYYYIETI